MMESDHIDQEIKKSTNFATMSGFLRYLQSCSATAKPVLIGNVRRANLSTIGLM